MTFGIVVLAFGLLYAAFKGCVVWSIAHDVYNGGGAPTLDFSILCPMPIACGTSLVLSALGWHPFPGFGLVAYLALVAAFWCLHSYFDRIGKPERQRQLAVILQQHDMPQKPMPDQPPSPLP